MWGVRLAPWDIDRGRVLLCDGFDDPGFRKMLRDVRFLGRITHWY